MQLSWKQYFLHVSIFVFCHLKDLNKNLLEFLVKACFSKLPLYMYTYDVKKSGCQVENSKAVGKL